MSGAWGRDPLAELRASVEQLGIAAVAAYLPFFSRYHSMSKEFIEQQVAKELQRQGADSGTANMAARQAADTYMMHSRMGNVSLQAVLKEAGTIAERIQKGFKYKAKR